MVRIVTRALAKAPEARYQTGRELADDLLALTRPAFVPALRATDVPTLPPDTPPGQVPTIVSPPTVRPEPTIGSAATAAWPAVPSATQPAPGAPPPLPPTILTPATVRQEAPPAPGRPAPAARPVPSASPAARRKGGGAGLVVGLGLAAVLGIAVVAGGAWFLFGRRAPAPSPSPSIDAAPATESATVEAPAVPPAARSRRPRLHRAPPRVRHPPLRPPRHRRRHRPRASPMPDRIALRGVPAVPPPADAASPGGSAGDDYSFLDEPPSDAPDGRAAGDALAQKYRSGGSTGYSTTRFRQRPKIPQGVAMPERPAVATLLYLSGSQEAFHRKSGATAPSGSSPTPACSCSTCHSTPKGSAAPATASG